MSWEEGASRWGDHLRSVAAVVAVLIAAWALNLAGEANHEVQVEEKQRIAASCKASTESRHEIIGVVHGITDFFRTPDAEPEDKAQLDAIVDSAKKALGGPSPLCTVPGAKPNG